MLFILTLFKLPFHFFLFLLFFSSFVFSQINSESGLVDSTNFLRTTITNSSSLLSAEDFLAMVVKKNPRFQKILIDEISAKYKKDLEVPLRELIFSANPEYSFSLNDEDDWQVDLEISQSIPSSGTEFYLGYSPKPTSSSSRNSQIEVGMIQPLVKNAFGRQNRYQLEIADLQWKQAKWSILESYEDLLKEMLEIYLDWVLAYYNLQAAILIEEEDQKIFEEVRERRKQNVALLIDVNKVELEVLSSQKQVMELSSQYFLEWQRIREVTGEAISKSIIPEIKKLDVNLPKDLDVFWQTLKEEGRVFRLVQALIKERTLAKKDAFWDMLPQVDLNVGYRANDRSPIFNQDTRHEVFTGLELSYNFLSTQEKANKKIAENQEKQSKLDQEIQLLSFRKSLLVLSHQIKQRKKIIELNEKEIEVAEKAFQEESQEYRIGRSTLRELINLIKGLSRLRYSLIQNQVSYNRLVAEWMRITDTLLTKR